MSKFQPLLAYSTLFMLLISPLKLLDAGEQLSNNVPDLLDDGVQSADPFVAPTPARFRLSFETVTLPGNEKMGFLGGTFLFDVNDWLSFGAASYGALTGQRGGFITLGLATEVRKKIGNNIEINTGVFAGGGGGRGGHLLSGGGLMLRYHAGIQFVSKWGNIGAGYSYLDFPNGTIHSGQPYFSYDYQFSTLFGKGWVDRPENESFGYTHVAEQEFAIISRFYSIPDGVLQDNGVRNQYRTINLLGVEWNRYLDKNFFIHLESEGAMGGQSQGYMQILLGGGYRLVLLDGTWFKVISSVGVAGGGNVATGGGLLLDSSAALQQKLGDHLYAEVSVGYVFAPGESFKAVSYNAKLGYHFNTPDYSEGVSLSDLEGFDFSHMRLRAVHQTYFKDSNNWRSRDKNLNVDLMGVQADYFLNDHLFVSGQGIAAYKGKAGAYMIGLVGMGVHLPVFGPVYIETEILGGAAGGGSLAVGGGLVWQVNAGVGVQVNDAYTIAASYGYLSAPHGKLRAKVLSLSLGYNFTLFTR